MKNEIIIYQDKELAAKVEVKIVDDTVWLTQTQIIVLFDSSKANISEHIKHIFQSGELYKESTVRKIRTVQSEGNREVARELAHYNLDVIISIGYRVNSIRGTQFRIWANQILKDHLLRGYSLNRRMNRVEDNMDTLIKKVDNIDLQLKTSLPPKQDVFFKGQIFDAYTFVSDLVRKANTSIILIDNYIDDTVLTHFTKRKKGVSFSILTKNISKQLSLDIKKHNEQYPAIVIKEFKEVYHFGASLKDLGKKCVITTT